jgi:uncharacterized protein (TIGR03083 family)
VSTTAIRLESIEPPTVREWIDLGRAVDVSILETLRSLADDEWSLITDCDPWTVKDSVAHLVGWIDATISPVEFIRQVRVGFMTRSDHGGSVLDAMNHHQVESRRHASPAELIARFEGAQPRFHSRRLILGALGKPIPFWEPFSGTRVNAAFMMGAVMARDQFMHRLDIHRAIGRAPDLRPAEIRIAHDAIREWAAKARADATLELSGPAGGTLVAGAGTTRITADALDLCRVLAGRKSDDIRIEGDEGAARRWLTTLAVF